MAGSLRLTIVLLIIHSAFAGRNAAHLQQGGGDGITLQGDQLPRKNYTLRVDYAIDDERRCWDFWADPKAVPAYRQAFRFVLDKVMDSLKLKYRVVRLSVRCAQPKPQYNSSMKRIKVSATFAPAMDLIEAIVLMDTYAFPFEDRGDFTQAVRKFGGGKWLPEYFEYEDSANYKTICLLDEPGCWDKPWNPLKTKPANMGISK